MVAPYRRLIFIFSTQPNGAGISGGKSDSSDKSESSDGSEAAAGGGIKKAPGFSARGSEGGYLLSHFRSTIGVVRLNFSVRNGKRWIPHAITTLVRFVRLTSLLTTRPCVLECH